MRLTLVLLAGLLAACASQYLPPTEGPRAQVRLFSSSVTSTAIGLVDGNAHSRIANLGIRQEALRIGMPKSNVSELFSKTPGQYVEVVFAASRELTLQFEFRNEYVRASETSCQRVSLTLSPNEQYEIGMLDDARSVRLHVRQLRSGQWLPRLDGFRVAACPAWH